MKEQNTHTTDKNAPKSNIITTTILGFNRTPSGLRLNTSPPLDIWVNSRKEYETYQELVGSEADFTPRLIKTRAGTTRKVFDLNVKSVSEDDLASLFDTDFSSVFEKDFPESENAEEVPF